MKKIGIGFIIFSLIILLAACGNEASTNDDEKNDAADSSTKATELRVGINAQPATLDIHTTGNVLTKNVVRHMYETLVTFNEEYEVVPMLAEKFEQSDDGKTYTFYLRKGVKFHNGKEMTAEDVTASMTRWLENTSPAKIILGDATFEAEDDYTVVLKLERASELILPVLARTSQQFAGIMPKEVIESADSSGVTEYIGTGPFKFKEWKESQYVHFEKFDDYEVLDIGEPIVKKEALVEDLYFYIVPDPATLLAGIQTGQYDIVIDLHTEYYEQLKDDDNLIADVEQYGINGLYFNKHKGIFTNEKARQAVNAALNIDDLLQAGFGHEDLYEANSSYVSKDQPIWYSEAGSEYYNQNDKEKAKKLLEEAGYNGETIRIISTRDYEYVYNSGVYVMNELEKIGLNVELDVYDYATMMSNRGNPDNWEIFIFSGPYLSVPVEMLVFSPTYFDGPLDDKTNSLVNDIITAETTDDAVGKWNELQEHSWQSIPFISVGHFSKLNVLSKDVQGYSRFDGPVLWGVTVDK